MLNMHALIAQLSALPKDAFAVGFYIHNTNISQDEWMNPLALYLHKKGFVTVGIQTPVSIGVSKLEHMDYKAIMEPGEIQYLKRINVFIISDMDCLDSFPETSKVLGCAHSFEICDHVTALPYQILYMGHLDGWMCPFPLNQQTMRHVHQLYDNFMDYDLLSRTSQYYYIIPTGYPRMCELALQLAQSSVTPDSIIFAPVDIGHNLEMGGERLKNHGKRIIRTLLSCFPQFNVIFRPYKKNLKEPVVQEICDYFANEKRFILDDNHGRFFSFSRGVMLVTDMSHIAKSFTFATRSPSIYFSPWDNTSEKYSYRNGFFRAGSYKCLVKAINQGVANLNEISGEIGEYSDKAVMPFANAFSDVAGWLKDFYNDRPRPDWIAIDRKNEPASDTRLTARLISQTSLAIPSLSAAALRYSWPHSPLMAAFALHQGMSILPDILYYLKINEIAGKICGEHLEFKRYIDTDPYMVRRLYSMALLEKIKARDAEGVFMTEKLLENFNCEFPDESQKGNIIEIEATNKNANTEVLNFERIQEKLASLPNNAFVIALYLNFRYVGQTEWLNHLAKYLKKKGYIILGLKTPGDTKISGFNQQTAGDFENTDYNTILPQDKIKELKGINIFILSDIDCGTHFPPESKVIACTHTFYHTPPPISFPESVQFSATLDGWMVPEVLTPETRELTNALWSRFVNVKYALRKSPNFQIIPMGYPKQAVLAKKLAQKSGQPDSILYAPYKMEILDPGGERVKEHGLLIIRCLLDNFPEYNVIFRPAPGNYDYPAVKEIITAFCNEPRFILDTEISKVNSFSRAAVIISDTSNITKNFAFLTLRPAIFFRPWLEWKDVNIYRWDCGFTTNTYDGLVEVVNTALKNAPEEAEIIRKNRDSQVMPFDNVFEEIVDLLPDFYNGKSRPEWLTIERNDPNKLIGDVELVKRIQKYCPWGDYVTAAVGARFNNQQSPLLIAYALHMGRLRAPHRWLAWGLRNIAMDLLHKNIPSIYGQVDPKDVINLYNKALVEMRQKDDRESITFTENLLHEFRELIGNNSEL